MVVSELRGEKIDIIPYNDEPARFVAKALSPARVREVLVDDDTKEATVIVPDDQLSLAIGRDGQNARLAARLTGWKVDIKSETEFAAEEDEMEYEGEEAADGRCLAILTTGRRCPNASLEGSHYCGIPQHQALARFDTNQVTVLTPLSEQEVQQLADPDASESDTRPLVERAMAEFAAADKEQAAPDEPEGGEADDEQALAQDAAAEGPEEPAAAEEPVASEEPAPAEDETPEETAPVGVQSSEESEAGGEGSEGVRSEES
jgi:N utilization substance protein A